MADIPPDDFHVGYFDAELWLRLQPRIEERRIVLARSILNGDPQSYDQYCRMQGQYSELTDVLKEAAHLTRKEPTEPEEE